MVKRTRHSGRSRHRLGVEQLESRELLSTLMEGLAANDLSGTAVAPLGNIFDDVATGLVGDDFAISAPAAQGARGEVYVIFGGPHLNQPGTLDGCISPPPRALTCSLIGNYLANRQALKIIGAGADDQFGFSVAGVGNAIGDSRPDVLIGAPFAINAGLERSGRGYLIGGEVIAGAISAAIAAGGSAQATIDLSVPIPATTTIRVFDGEADGDQAGNSVSGLGLGAFIIGAPKNGSAGKMERGAAYVFGSLRGVTGRGNLTPQSTLRGPSLGAHLGGVPAEELTSTGYRGYGVSGIRNPALIPVPDEMLNDPRYNLIGGLEPDVLVGAPDACLDNACTLPSAERNGMAYLLSGTALLTLGGTYDLSSDTDLKALGAIPVRGAANGDRLGTALSPAGDFDGDGRSDFMFSAPRRDVGTGATLLDAGEVYLVFGREVVDTPYPDGNCQSDPSVTTGPQQNFRQCRDAAGQVVPLNAGSFIAPGHQVGLTLRGDRAGERAGIALGEARNVADPLGRTLFASPSQIGINEVIIGSPLRDNNAGATLLPQAGRAYVLFGSKDYETASGVALTISVLEPSGAGQIFDGRAPNDHYGMSVNGAGNPHDPLGVIGDDVLIGSNQADVIFPPSTTVSPNVGETELLFGAVFGGGIPVFVPSLLPFVQPGPFGPQIIAGGFWSFVNAQPSGASVVFLPLCAGLPQPLETVTALCPIQLQTLPGQGDFLFPAYTVGMNPLGSMGPFVSSLSVGNTTFYPGKAATESSIVGKSQKKQLKAQGTAAPTQGGKLSKKAKLARLTAQRLELIGDLGAASQ